MEAKLKKLSNININELVGGKYAIEKYHAGGGFGMIYSGHDVDTGSEVAIKFELNSMKLLAVEYRRYVRFNGTVGFPQVYWYGDFSEYKALVMQLLGQSIKSFMSSLRARRKTQMIYPIGYQMIQILSIVHNRGFVHHDVSPSNFVMGRNSSNSQNTVHIIDFGSSTYYSTIRPIHDPIYVTDRSRHMKTQNYCSINVMKYADHTFTPLDDLESLGYVFVSFLKALPWSSYSSSSDVLHAKESITINELTNGLPTPLYYYFKYIKSISSTNIRVEDIDYDYLQNLFKRNSDMKPTLSSTLKTQLRHTVFGLE